MNAPTEFPTFNYEIEAELLARTRALLPLFARNAENADIERSIPQENVDALDEAGLLAVNLPKTCGGPGAPWTTFCKIGLEIARVCPSTSWTYSLMGTSGWFASTLPEPLRGEILADGVPRISGAVTPGGIIEEIDGDYVVTGRWPYSTGCLWMKWAVLSASLRRKDGSLEPGYTALLRANEVSVEDTWFVTGMRGTASSTIVANGVRAASHRILRPGGESVRPLDVPKGAAPSDWYPFIALLVTTNSVVSIGAAQAMLSKVLTDADRRAIHYSIYERLGASQVAQTEISKAALKLRSAEQILWRSTHHLDQTAEARVDMPLDDRALIRGEQAYINTLVRDAADALLTVYGTTAFLVPNLLERHWRDINVISRHSIVHTNSGFEVYGRALLGEEYNIIPGML